MVNKDIDGVIDTIRCFALDMDGTIYLGEQWIEGAKEFLKKIEDSGRTFAFLTNNSSKSANNYVDKLNRMGLTITKNQIITSGQATIYYLKKHFPDKKIFLLGNDLLTEEFCNEGMELTQENPDVVVTAFDTSLDYQKLCKVCDFVRNGVPYLATHPDFNCPTENGFIPDIGAIHAFIKASTGREPDRIIGKPNGDIIDYFISRYSYPREQIAMVGDRLYTDIAAGRKNGLKSILVLSGEAKLEEVKDAIYPPHLIFQSVKELIPLLK